MQLACREEGELLVQTVRKPSSSGEGKGQIPIPIILISSECLKFLASALRFLCECHSMTQAGRTFSLGLETPPLQSCKNVAKIKILQSQIRNLSMFLPLSILHSVKPLRFHIQETSEGIELKVSMFFMFFAELYSSCKVRHCSSVQYALRILMCKCKLCTKKTDLQSPARCTLQSP